LDQCGIETHEDHDADVIFVTAFNWTSVVLKLFTGILKGAFIGAF